MNVLAFALLFCLPSASSAQSLFVGPAPPATIVPVVLPVPDVVSSSALRTGASLTATGAESGTDSEACAERCKAMRTGLFDASVVLTVGSAAAMFTASAFGLGNRIALGQGITKPELEPTRWVHRGAAATATGFYFSSAALGIAMSDLGRRFPGTSPGPGPKTPLGKRLHVGLSVAHFATMIGTLATGIVQAHVLQSGPAWEGTVTAHHALASTTATLLVIGAAVAFEM